MVEIIIGRDICPWQLVGRICCGCCWSFVVTGRGGLASPTAMCAFPIICRPRKLLVINWGHLWLYWHHYEIVMGDRPMYAVALSTWFWGWKCSRNSGGNHMICKFFSGYNSVKFALLSKWCIMSVNKFGNGLFQLLRLFSGPPVFSSIHPLNV